MPAAACLAAVSTMQVPAAAVQAMGEKIGADWLFIPVVAITAPEETVSFTLGGICIWRGELPVVSFCRNTYIGTKSILVLKGDLSLVPHTEYQNITKKAKTLLSRQEGLDVDFKRNAKSLEDCDLVAFANSDHGGTILLGIDENKGPDGRHKAIIIGCSAGDDDKRQISSKAANCIPSIEINIIVENLKDKPFLRIEIPPGLHKPYCTGSGRYVIRDNGHNKPLTPPMLLNLFMIYEGEQFLHRFKTATEQLYAELKGTKNRLSEELRDLYKTVQDMNIEVSNFLDSMSETINNTESLADDAMCFSDEANGNILEVRENIENLESTSQDVDRKLDALLRYFEIEDPRLTQLRNQVFQCIDLFKERNKNIDHENLRKELKTTFTYVPMNLIDRFIFEKEKNESTCNKSAAK